MCVNKHNTGFVIPQAHLCLFTHILINHTVPKQLSKQYRMPVPKRTHAYLEEIAAAAFKADPAKSHRSLSKDWGFERAYLHKLISGTAPAGSTVVARASLSIPTSQARDLIERYLMDIGDQIDFERRRLRPNSLEPDGRYEVRVSVSWIPGQRERLPEFSMPPLAPSPLPCERGSPPSETAGSPL